MFGSFPMSFKGYTIRKAINDVIAGITVGMYIWGYSKVAKTFLIFLFRIWPHAIVFLAMVAIPQSMAYGLLAGVSPQYGLYSALFTTTFYSLLATSRQNNVGATATMEIFVGEIVDAKFDAIGTNDAVFRSKK